MSDNIYDPFASDDENDTLGVDVQSSGYAVASTPVSDPYEHDDDTTPIEQPKNDRPTRKSSSRKPNPRKVIIDGIRKADEVRQMSSDDRSTLSSLLGVRDDVAEIAAALVTGVKPNTQAIDDILEVVNAEDDFDAAIKAMTILDKGQARGNAVWSILSKYASISETLPRNTKTASMEFARAARGLSASEIDELQSPLKVLV